MMDSEQRVTVDGRRRGDAVLKVGEECEEEGGHGDDDSEQ